MRYTLLMILGSIFYISSAINFEATLIVKLTHLYRISDSNLGLLLGLTTVIMAAGGIPWGYWADKYPRNRLLSFSLAITALSMFTSAVGLYLQLPYAVYFVFKLLAGLGLAGVGPIALSAIMDTIPAQKRAAAMGWVGVAYAIGAGSGMFLSSICMQLGLGLGFAYLLSAILGLFFSLWPLLVREPRRGSQDEALKDAFVTGREEYRHHITLMDFKVIFSKPINLQLLALNIFIQFLCNSF